MSTYDLVFLITTLYFPKILLQIVFLAFITSLFANWVKRTTV